MIVCGGQHAGDRLTTPIYARGIAMCSSCTLEPTPVGVSGVRRENWKYSLAAGWGDGGGEGGREDPIPPCVYARGRNIRTQYLALGRAARLGARVKVNALGGGGVAGWEVGARVDPLHRHTA